MEEAGGREDRVGGRVEFENGCEIVSLIYLLFIGTGYHLICAPPAISVRRLPMAKLGKRRYAYGKVNQGRSGGMWTG
jgi:hypothetical protein